MSSLYASATLFEHPPHIHALASHVYQCMLGLHTDTEPHDQCIVIR